jgi:hypothetical protein
MGGQTDVRTDGLMDWQTYGQMAGLTDRWMDRRRDGQMDKWSDGWTDGRQMDGQTVGQMDG